jgi:hypothetical protein
VGDRPGSPPGAVSFLPEGIEGIVHKQARGWQAALGVRQAQELCLKRAAQGPVSTGVGTAREALRVLSAFCPKASCTNKPEAGRQPLGSRAQGQELCLKRAAQGLVSTGVGDRPGSPAGAVVFLPEGIVHKQARRWQAALGVCEPRIKSSA